MAFLSSLPHRGVLATLMVAVLLVATCAASIGKWETVVSAHRGVGYNSLACKTDNTCYLATGGYAGGYAATFDGNKLFQNLKNLTWGSGNGSPIAMAAAGSSVVTAGFSSGSIKRLSGRGFVPSSTPGVKSPDAQSVGMTSDGNTVVIPLRFKQAGRVLVSANGGVSFTEHSINVALPQDSHTTVAVIDSNTWYIAGGNNGAGISKNKVTSAFVIRTTNGGASYESVFNSTGVFFFNSISCQGASKCVAAGTSYEKTPGVHVYRTTNGVNWENAYTLNDGPNNYPIYQANKVMFSSPNTVWLLGSLSGSRSGGYSMWLLSKNAGASWKSISDGPGWGVENVLDACFLPDGTGYAYGIAQDMEYIYYQGMKYIP